MASPDCLFIYLCYMFPKKYGCVTENSEIGLLLSFGLNLTAHSEVICKLHILDLR